MGERKGKEEKKRKRRGREGEELNIMGMLLVGKSFEKRKDSNILAGDATRHKPTFWTKWWSLKSDKLPHLLAKRNAPSLGSLAEFLTFAQTLLTFASLKGQTEIVKYLLSLRTIDVNQVCSSICNLHQS